jgi:hypothetical protein
MMSCEQIRIEMVTTVLGQDNVSEICKLKIDSEDHYSIILNSFFDHAKCNL